MCFCVMLNFDGILVGASTFLAIALCHPLVIKAEYHLGKRSWRLFLSAGAVCALCSLFMENFIPSTVFGAFSFSFFWGILEVFQQERRVLKRWFPENPKRADYYARLRREKGYE